jgi:hypothetical protein
LKESLRLWWILNRERAGLVIPVLVLALVVVLFRPASHPTTISGVVTAINVQGGKRQPAFNAWVDLGGSRTIIGLEAGHGCIVGSRIAVEKVHFSFARLYSFEHYAVSGHGCAAPPATGR